MCIYIYKNFIKPLVPNAKLLLIFGCFTLAWFVVVLICLFRCKVVRMLLDLDTLLIEIWFMLALQFLAIGQLNIF